MREALRVAVLDARRQLAEGWPVVVDTTKWAWTDGAISVSGGVLVRAQARVYADAIGSTVGEAPAPTILSDLASTWTEHRWAALTPGDAIDLHRQADGDDRQTQWSPPAHVRRFAVQARRALVQIPDGTLGWVDAERLADAAPDADPWGDIARALAGTAVTADRPTGLQDAARRARARLGRPYLWGGNTEHAADCSGLVQSLVWQASGVLLPKHTGDQRRLGDRVGAGSIAPGDLVFVKGRNKGLSHVGLALPAEETTTVVHSCLTRNQVMEEPLSTFLERYRFVGARRPIAWRDA
ncbi:MAG: C40 family peptidase [Proteobacteria bacterium]|nr:C40 family peptidase [Pseudomonadota bacterium]